MGKATTALKLALLFVADDPARAQAYPETAARLFRTIGHAGDTRDPEQLLRRLGG